MADCAFAADAVSAAVPIAPIAMKAVRMFRMNAPLASQTAPARRTPSVARRAHTEITNGGAGVSAIKFAKYSEP
jgi:hypothetical protein